MSEDTEKGVYWTRMSCKKVQLLREREKKPWEV